MSASGPLVFPFYSNSMRDCCRNEILLTVLTCHVRNTLIRKLKSYDIFDKNYECFQMTPTKYFILFPVCIWSKYLIRMP